MPVLHSARALGSFKKRSSREISGQDRLLSPSSKAARHVNQQPSTPQGSLEPWHPARQRVHPLAPQLCFLGPPNTLNLKPGMPEKAKPCIPHPPGLRPDTSHLAKARETWKPIFQKVQTLPPTRPQKLPIVATSVIANILVLYPQYRYSIIYLKYTLK